MSLPWPSAPHNSRLYHCFSITDPPGPTSDLYDMHRCWTVVYGDCIYRFVFRIRYRTSFAIHLEDTHPDHPPDLLAFLVIVFLVVRSNVAKVPIPSILKTIVRDATYYFLAISISHLVSVMFLGFASVGTSSEPSLFSPRLAYTFAGWNQVAPRSVSDAGTCSFCSLTELSPAKQRKRGVRPNTS